jgi:hypothetical protein
MHNYTGEYWALLNPQTADRAIDARLRHAKQRRWQWRLTNVLACLCAPLAALLWSVVVWGREMCGELPGDEPDWTRESED